MKIGGLVLFILATAFLVVFFNFSKTARSSSTPFTFAAVGDIGGNSRSDATLTNLASSGAEFNLAIGDLSYSEKVPEGVWCDYIKSYLGANYPFELVVGNHEEDAGPDGHIDNFIPCLPDRLNSMGTYGKEYYFDYPQATPLARFILISPDLTLNGEKYNYTLGGTRYNWLANTIDNARNSGIKWIVVGMHKVCITTGVKSCEIGTDLMNLLLDRKVDLVLQGHDHNYQRSKQLALSTNCQSLLINGFDQDCVVNETNVLTKNQGTVIVITGTGGRGTTSPNPADPEAAYFATWVPLSTQVNGFTKFVVSENDLNVTFVPSVGGYTDSFSIVASGFTPTPTPTPLPTDIITIPILEDATIKSGSPSSNYGFSGSLEVDNSPVEDFLLKFNVNGVNGRAVISSKLRLHNINESSLGGNFYTAGNSWTQAAVTWNSAPTIGSQVGSLGAVAPGNLYEVNIQNYITGDNVYSFRVKSISSNGADYASKENITFAPQLVLTVLSSGVSPTPTQSPSPTATPTPIPTATPTPSPPPTSTSSPSPSTLVFSPTSDAHVRSDNPNSNYGSSSKLEADGSPIKRALMKFSVNGIGGSPVASAKLRLYNVDSSSSGGSLRSAQNTWTETGVTWNNAPAPDTAVLGTLGSVSPGNWYEINLTGFLNSDGEYSFDLSSTNTNGADYSSREGANPPQLVIETQ